MFYFFKYHPLAHRTSAGERDFDKLYHLSRKIKGDWMTAYDFCRKINMALVTLDEEREAFTFLSMILIYAKSQMDLKRAHVGAISNVLGSRTEWYWISNDNGLKKLNFPLQWQTNEPNGNGKEYCMEVDVRRTFGIFEDRVGFNDIACHYPQTQDHFICQQIIR